MARYREIIQRNNFAIILFEIQFARDNARDCQDLQLFILREINQYKYCKYFLRESYKLRMPSSKSSSSSKSFCVCLRVTVVEETVILPSHGYTHISPRSFCRIYNFSIRRVLDLSCLRLRRVLRKEMAEFAELLQEELRKNIAERWSSQQNCEAVFAEILRSHRV